MNLHDFFPLVNTAQKGIYLMATGTMVLAAFFGAVIEISRGLIPEGYSPVQTVWSAVLEYFVHHKVPMIMTWAGATIVGATSAYVVLVESIGTCHLVSSSLWGTDRNYSA